MALVVAVLVALALWPAAAGASQHERTAAPPDPRPISGACPGERVPDAGFTDVSADSPHALAVGCAAWYGIAQGGPGARPAEEYGPRLAVRRDQMASFIVRFIDHSLGELPEWDGQNRFRDVGAGSPHVGPINRLAAAGVVAGGPGGAPETDYGPAQDVRRDQMASFIKRSLDAILPEPLTTDEVYFDDLDGVFAEHADNINVLAEEGIAAGHPLDGHRHYAPNGDVRRDQMASFLMRAMDLLVDLHMAPLPEPGQPSEPRTEQSYIQAPQEVVTGAPGDSFEITVSGFDEANPAPVNIALFPCDVADPADPDDHTFRDANGDGRADGIATSDTGAAVITRLHGDATDTTHLDRVQPDGQGLIVYSIHSDQPDCTIPVAFHDANNNDQLDVNAQGQPLEHWNYTERAWEGDDAGAGEAVAVTADGRVVVLDTGTGEEVRQLMTGVRTDDPAKNDIAVTPDGRNAYVAVPAEDTVGEEEIVRVPTAGGSPELVTTGGSSPAVSPDGSTLAYVVFVGPGPGDPDPRLVLRDLTTGQDVQLSGTDDPLHFISDVEWTADGTELLFTAGEINTSVYAIHADATSMAEARRLGPSAQPGSDASWGSTAAFGDQLAVVERCCDVGFEERWRIISVDAADGSVAGRLVPVQRIEATHLDSNAETTGLLIVEGGGPGGGTLLRWHGSGSPQAVTDDVIVAAW